MSFLHNDTIYVTIEHIIFNHIYMSPLESGAQIEKWAQILVEIAQKSPSSRYDMLRFAQTIEAILWLPPDQQDFNGLARDMKNTFPDEVTNMIVWSEYFPEGLRSALGNEIVFPRHISQKVGGVNVGVYDQTLQVFLDICHPDIKQIIQAGTPVKTHRELAEKIATFDIQLLQSYLWDARVHSNIRMEILCAASKYSPELLSWESLQKMASQTLFYTPANEHGVQYLQTKATPVLTLLVSANRKCFKMYGFTQTQTGYQGSIDGREVQFDHQGNKITL